MIATVSRAKVDEIWEKVNIIQQENAVVYHASQHGCSIWV